MIRIPLHRRRLRLTPLGPMCFGRGEQLGPHEARLEGRQVMAVDPLRWMSLLEPARRAELAAQADGPDGLRALHRALHGCDDPRLAARELMLASSAVQAAWADYLAGRGSPSFRLVRGATRRPDGTPFIPGRNLLAALKSGAGTHPPLALGDAACVAGTARSVAVRVSRYTRTAPPRPVVAGRAEWVETLMPLGDMDFESVASGPPALLDALGEAARARWTRALERLLGELQAPRAEALPQSSLAVFCERAERALAQVHADEAPAFLLRLGAGVGHAASRSQWLAELSHAAAGTPALSTVMPMGWFLARWVPWMAA
jgi:hypothetical protein